MIRIPVIKIKSNGHDHIVGFNHHDHLYVKDNKISYLDSQCMCGTEYEEYSFIPQNNDVEYTASACPEIEFVTMEEFVKLCIEYEKEDAEATTRLMEMLRDYNDNHDNMTRKIKDKRKKTGINIMS